MNKKNITILILVFCLAIFTKEAQAAIEIKYQAKLTDDYGKVVVDGDYHMKFKIWGIEDASKILWEETWTKINKVKVKNGIFETKLGQINPLVFNFKDEAYYLSCVVGGKEETPNWNKGISLVKKIKLVDLKFKIDALDIKISENLDKILETTTATSAISETFTEDDFGKEYSFSELFFDFRKMILDVYFNFDKKVEKTLSSLGMVIKDGIASVKEIISNKITTKDAYIENAEIEKAQVKNFEVSEKIQLYDQVTKQGYCIWLENGEWKKIKGMCKDYLGSVSVSLDQQGLTNSTTATSTITTIIATTTMAIATTTATSTTDNTSITEKNTTATSTNEKAQVKNFEVSEKIQLYDQVTKQAYCIWIENKEWKKLEGTCEDYLGSIDLPLVQESAKKKIPATSTTETTSITEEIAATTTTTTTAESLIVETEKASSIEETNTAAQSTSESANNSTLENTINEFLQPSQ
ncbi:hypothetical protein KKF17_00700 [Patescibacteria group bacterium]|nr:hypothetical protein [Patescibacteria group bacterium]